MIIGRNRPGGPATQAIEGSNNVTTFSDAELQELIQAYLDGGGNIANLRFDNKGEAHAIHAYVVTGELYSPEAEAVFANMPTTPTDPQKQAIAAFVDSLVAVDIWAKIDHFNFMGSGLSWPENNALTDWIAGRTAIKNGTPTLGLDGYDFNGVDQWLDSSYNPSTDGTAYQLNDAMAGAFVIEKGTEASNFPSLFGAITDGDTTQRIQLFVDEGAGNLVAFAVNSDAPNTTKVFRNDSFYVADRSQAGQMRLIENGANPEAEDTSSVAIPVNNIHIASRLFNAAGGEFFAGKITTFLAGGSLTDPQHVTLYNSLIQLLIDFDVFAGPVLARFATLTAAEQTAVRNFVNTEVKNGNWFLYDEFFCFAFTNSADCLTGFRSKTATNVNAATFDGTGVVLTGTEYLDTNFTPSTDGVNFKQDDAIAGAFCKSNGNTALQNAAFFGLSVGAGSSGTTNLIQQPNNTRVQFRINASLQQNVNAIDFIGSNKLYMLERSGASSVRLLEDAITISSSESNNSSAISTGEFFIGNIGLGVPFVGTISSFVVGAAIGFDHPGHNAAVRQLLTELGAI